MNIFGIIDGDICKMHIGVEASTIAWPYGFIILAFNECASTVRCTLFSVQCKLYTYRLALVLTRINVRSLHVAHCVMHRTIFNFISIQFVLERKNKWSDEKINFPKCFYSF